MRAIQVGDAVRMRGQQLVMTVFATNEAERAKDLSEPRMVNTAWHNNSGQPLQGQFLEACLEVVERKEHE